MIGRETRGGGGGEVLGEWVTQACVVRGQHEAVGHCFKSLEQQPHPQHILHGQTLRLYSTVQHSSVQNTSERLQNDFRTASERGSSAYTKHVYDAICPVPIHDSHHRTPPVLIRGLCEIISMVV
jgi:hypothetical protein